MIDQETFSLAYFALGFIEGAAWQAGDREPPDLQAMADACGEVAQYHKSVGEEENAKALLDTAESLYQLGSELDGKTKKHAQ